MDPFIACVIEHLAGYDTTFTLEISWRDGIVWVCITPSGEEVQCGDFYYNRFSQWVPVQDWAN